MARRSRAGGAKKRPTLYCGASAPKSEVLRRALREHRHGRLLSAVQLYDEVLAEDPESLDAWMNRGTAAVALGHVTEALSAFARAYVLDPQNARATRDAGIGLFALGEFQSAREMLSISLSLDPASIGARLVMARLGLDTGDTANAQAHAVQAVHLAPDDPSAHLELHRATFDDENLDLSVGMAERAVQLDPGYDFARICLAAAWDRMGRSEDAYALLRHAAGSLTLSAQDAHHYLHAHPARAFSNKRQTLQYALSLAERGGSFLEFGVRHGISTRWIAERVSTLHAFDSFVGLPEPWVTGSDGAFSTAGRVPRLPSNVEVHVGLFEDTLPHFVASAFLSPSFVHIDSDLYSSAKCVFDFLGPRMGPGCVVVFDEYLGNEGWREHEFKAFQDACKLFKWTYDYRALCWITGQAVIQLR